MAQYVYGKNVISSLIKNNKEIVCLYIQSSRNDDSIQQLAIKNKIPYKVVDRKKLDSLVQGNHQGYVAEVVDYKTYDIDEIVNSIPAGKQPLIIACDGLEDPHNLGAILRTAACVGADGVIIEKNRSVSLTSTVAKVSVGAIDIVKVASVTNLSQTLLSLKDKGYWVVGTDVDGAVDYRTVDYNMPVVLVIGSEGKGMHRIVREKCDIKITLPMCNEMNSLNASVAAGIILYQIYSCRFPVNFK